MTTPDPRRRRGAPAVAVLALTGLALAGCEKPAPGATVWSGTTSDHREAQCWSFDASRPVDPKTCLQNRGRIGQVDVVPGSTVGISVDKLVADSGWYPAIGNQRLTAQPVTTTYYRFALGEQDLVQPLELRIIALDAKGNAPRGLWLFRLARAGA